MLEEKFMYPENEVRHPPHVKFLLVLIITAAAHPITTAVELSDPVSGTLVSVFVFALAVFVGAYMSMAIFRYNQGLKAIALTTSTVHSIGGQIRELDDEDMRKECHNAIVGFLRAVYADLRGWSDESRAEHSVETYIIAYAWACDTFKKAGLLGALLNGNGAFNRTLLGRADAKTTVSVRLSKGAKWAAMSMFPPAAVVFALFLPESGLPWWLQALAFGSFCYGVTLMIAVAEDVSQPFGIGHSKVALRERFLKWEEQLRILATHPKKETPAT